MPGASVIVPARDAAATIGRTLAGLARQAPSGSMEVIVVDDGSTDATAAIAGAAAVQPTVVEGRGEGPARARNLGVRAASAPVLAFLDADCDPQPGWLDAGLRALEEADLVQGAVRPPPRAAPGPFDRTLWVNCESGLYETANLFVRRETFDAVGGFESWLRPRSGIELGEDILFGWRARRAGARTAFAADAVAHHAVFGRGPHDYVAERARLRFFPAIAARVPELREQFFFRRVFLSSRSAAFDLALAAAGAALAGRRPAAAAAAAPYAFLLARHSRRAGRRRWAAVALADLAADAVGAAALAVGSVRHRSPLL